MSDVGGRAGRRAHAGAAVRGAVTSSPPVTTSAGRRRQARLTRTAADGDVSMGLAGSWAAGAVLVDGNEPARFDQVTTGRAAIFTAGRPVRLADHRDGWRWEPYAVDGTDVEAARQQLQHLMRDAEADIAEALSNGGWLTVLDGPLHGIRHRRGLPVIGYVKTHHRRMLAREHWVRVPELTVGERSGLFAWRTRSTAATCAWATLARGQVPWAGIARLEMPSGIGRAAAVEAADRAAGWLPSFASALHRDARAPVNLTPIAGLERHLHRRQGDARLALRAVREAVLEHNHEGRVVMLLGGGRQEKETMRTRRLRTGKAVARNVHLRGCGFPPRGFASTPTPRSGAGRPRTFAGPLVRVSCRCLARSPRIHEPPFHPPLVARP